MARAPKPRRGGLGDNGGPPLEEPEHIPEWGKGGVGTYFWWKRARTRSWRRVSPEMMLRRLEKAEALGLTYEEYTLEVMERGRFLQVEDTARAAAIRAKRKRRPAE